MSEEELNKIYEESAAEAAPEAAALIEPTSAPAPTEQQMFEYTANGRPVKEPIDMVLKRASMGYNYAQHMEQLSAKEKEIQARFDQAQQIESRWKQYDDYAKTNPAWAEHVQQAWDNRTNLGTPDGGQPAIDPAFQQELGSLKEQVANISQFVQQSRNQAADSEYHTQFTAVKDAYPHVDLYQSDPNTGKTLEYSVLEFAREHGITDFRHAFKAFYGDKLMDAERDRIRQEVIADLQKNRKAGIMGVSSKPTQPSPHGDVRRMSEDELMRAAANDQELWGS